MGDDPTAPKTDKELPEVEPKESEDVNEYEGRTATFQYNLSDTYKGMVVIHSILGEEIEVSMEDLVEFMAEAYVRPRLIRCINGTSAEDLLLNQLEPLQ